MASTVSCIVVTTLFVVSIANLLLLVNVAMQGFKYCDSKFTKRLQSYLPRPRKDDEPSSHHQANLEELLMVDYRQDIARFKFLVSIVSLDSGDVEFLCSASVIDKRWILTAAHCAEKAAKTPLDKLRVSSNSSKVKYGIWHDLDKIVLHDKYDRYRHYNDIALLSVKQPFKLPKEVVAVALPSEHLAYLANSSALSLGFAAFGAKNKSKDYAESLYGIRVRLFAANYCANRYDDRALDKNVFCAGKYRDERNVCILDEGGQLVHDGVLIGIVAFGTGCDFDGRPVVYTKIGNFEKWIKEVDKKYEAEMDLVFKSTV